MMVLAAGVGLRLRRRLFLVLVRLRGVVNQSNIEGVVSKERSL
jgi:hypothetical protein